MTAEMGPVVENDRWVPADGADCITIVADARLLRAERIMFGAKSICIHIYIYNV